MDTVILNPTTLSTSEPVLVPIDLIDPNPYQPRQAEDPAAVAEIAESIRRNGLMQVPSAREVVGRYQLAFGHTRLAAYKLNGETHMPLFVRELDDLQMFELGVSENIKRRNLNSIEQAQAMKLYMEEFEKTSVEAGEFFGVSEEQIRGTVRLLNLHPDAQQAMKAGTINITTARTLLSMQKVAPEKAIVETVKRLAAGRDEFDDRAVPEEIIERAVDNLEETVDMWSDNRDGKPRSSLQSGWLLSMKNFPVKYLPYLTPVDLAVALGIQDDQDMIARANTYKMWKTGELDRTEEQIQAMQLPAELAAKIDHLMNPPSCSTCPFYTRINGSHYCGVKVCHTRKTVAWKRHTIEMASGSLGIPIYRDSDGKREVLSYDQEKLFTARHKDLRLIERDKVRGYHWQSFPGVDDHTFLVVMTGKTLEDKAAALKEVRAVEKAQETAETKRERLRSRMRERLYWESTQWLKAMFEDMNPPAIETFLALTMFDTDPPNDEFEEVDEQAPAEKRADYVRRTLAYAMLEEKDSFVLRQSWTTAAQIAAWLAETAKGWGITLPRAFFKIAEALDDEIRAVTAVTPKAKTGKGKK